MKRLTAIVIGAAAVAGLAAGCSSGTTSSASGPSSSSASSASTSAGGSGSSSGGAVVKAQNSSLGQILVDGSGRTLYLFKADTGTTSTCNGACAQAWPPLTTNGKPQAAGVSAGMLGTTTRADGKTEVTYAGHPLYYFAGDARSGDTKGQAVNAFGALWYVVGPNGQAITSAGGSGSSSSGSGGSGGYGY